MGGLHIEMAGLKLPGEWHDKSGWTDALIEANTTLTLSGRADAIVNAKHITRSRYIHQVTAVALYTLQCTEYDDYTS